MTQASDWSGIGQRMAAAGMAAPVIVKPLVACGVSEAHAMTIVLRLAGFDGISRALPACVQEYVDHAAALYKVYVIGSEVILRSPATSRIKCSLTTCLPDDERVAVQVVRQTQRAAAAQVHIVQKQSLPDLGPLSIGQLDELPAAVPFDSLADALPQELQARTAPRPIGVWCI